MSSPLVRWGTGFRRHGDHLRAKKYFTEAIEANPRDTEALIARVASELARIRKCAPNQEAAA